MSGRVNAQGIRAPQAAPGVQGTVGDILRDYPELAPLLNRTVAWRDAYQPDRRSKGFERQYPGFRPNPHGSAGV